MGATRTLTLDDAILVARDMREHDRACIQALMPGVQDEQFAVNRWQTDGPAWTLLNDQFEPVAIGGISFQSEWCGVFWFVARPCIQRKQWEKAIRTLDTVLSCVQDPNNPNFKRRLEAYTLGGWDAAERFAASRFDFEGTKRGAGSRGEDILLWARVADKKGL